jgi:general secretion pathway protein D
VKNSARLGTRFFILFFVIHLPGVAQDQPKPLEFKFAEADLQGVLQFVSKHTGYVFVNEAGAKITVTAVSDAPVPREKVLDFLNAVLRPKELAAVKVNDVVVKIVTLDEAKRKNTQIFFGTDPSKIEASDRIITQIVPLKTLSLTDFDQGLRALVPQTSQIARDQANNALILTDTAENVKRFLEFVSRLDGVDSILKTKVVKLKNADPAEVTRILGEYVRRETSSGAPGSPVKSVKLISDPRTNSIIVTATEENLKILDPLINELDQTAGNVVQIKCYALKGAAATDVANTLMSLLKQETGPHADKVKGWQWWDEKQFADVASVYPIKAFADQRANTLIVTLMAEQVALIDKIVAAVDVDPGLNVYSLKFADAKELAATLGQMTQGMLPPPKINADSRTNSLLISATEEQMKLLSMAIGELDRQVQESLRMKRYTLKNADPSEITELLGGVFKSQQGVLTKPVDAIVNRRTNSILVKAPTEYFPIIDELVSSLDTFPREEEITYVARLKSVDAKHVARILNELQMGTVVSELGDTPKAPDAPRPATVPTPSEKPNQGEQPLPTIPAPAVTPKQDAPYREPATKGLDVQTADDSNILVIRTPKKNLEAVKQLIRDLDQHRPQVLIKVLIADVTLDNDVQYGVEGFWKDGKSTTKTLLGTGVSGFSYLLAADRYEVKLQALAEKGLLKILATPRILAMDNAQAKFTVGKRVPHITDSRESPFGAVFNTVFYADVGIILKVTPKIYPDGMVMLDVNPEISDVASAAEAVPIGPGATAPTFIKNSAETRVTVKNGQTVILGGLIREADEQSTTGVPLLGDIPVLGNLFSKTTKSKNRRELMIFLTPHVIYSQMELEELTRLEAAKLKLVDTRPLNQEMKRWLDDLDR